MAVIFDNRSEGQVTTGEALTFSHLCSLGENRVLYAAIAHEEGTNEVDTVTATYAGVAMDVKFTDLATHGGKRTRVFRLVAPAVSGNDIVFSWTGNSGFRAITASFTGVDQVTPDDIHVLTDGSAGDVASTRIVASAADDMVMDVIVNSPAITTLVPGGSQTEIHQEQGAGINSIGSSFWAGASSRDMTWTWAEFDSYVHWAWNINAVGEVVVGPGPVNSQDTTHLVRPFNMQKGRR